MDCSRLLQIFFFSKFKNENIPTVLQIFLKFRKHAFVIRIICAHIACKFVWRLTGSLLCLLYLQQFMKSFKCLLSCLSLSCDCQRVLSGELMVRFCNRRETLLVSHLGILREFKPMEDKGKINFERCSTNMTGQGIFFVFLEWSSFFRYLFAQSD